MAHSWPDELSNIAALLDELAGSFLDGVGRESGLVCTICSAPVDRGFSTCYPCNAFAESPLPTADRVSSMVYAVEPDSQAYQVVRNYKADRPGPNLRFIMVALMALGLRGHTGCVGRIAGVGVDGWAVVPSTRGRTTLRDIVAAVSTRPESEIAVQFHGKSGERQLMPDHWSVALPTERLSTAG